MSTSAFDAFFRAATAIATDREGNAPYDYQCRLACGDRGDRTKTDWLAGGTRCESQLISIPTGLGKTAAVALAWLWNRAELKRSDWPRRLVMCLPMRTLVEQTRDNVRGWLGDRHLDGKGNYTGKVGLHILMGGEESEDWDLHPEADAILIGTQDMLLSRALNRGYGMSRFRWPMHFGLLNHDCLFVLDETQLMGVGVETSAQLAGLRSKFLSARPHHSWWMSATLDTRQLDTIDHPLPREGWSRLQLSPADYAQASVVARVRAQKPIACAPFALTPASAKKDYARQLATLIVDRHQMGSLTLVVVNRVSRAQEIYEHLLNKLKVAPERLALVHSRFRPADRAAQQARLLAGGDMIVIATQAVEAGVDVSARLLITELAPWSSLVQRFGRCNRRGDDPAARAVWIDIQPQDPSAEQDELALPYPPTELTLARESATSLNDAGPQSLEKIVVQPALPIRPVLRRKDLLDLFDTTLDLAGQDLDISRYIRDGDDVDVHVFWRDLNDQTPTSDVAPPTRAELCRVAVNRFADFLKSKSAPRALVHNPLDGRWVDFGKRRPLPGAVYLLDVSAGGYSAQLGWTGAPSDKPVPPFASAVAQLPCESSSYAGDEPTFAREWMTLRAHTTEVEKVAAEIAAALSFTSAQTAMLTLAARWHDVGKAHDAFQTMLRASAPLPPDADADELWAKSPGRGKRSSSRPYFRHELASALAWMVNAPANAPERDLVAYLIAAHHGKVRLSLRALPNEKQPANNPTLKIARGVHDGDRLRPVSIAGLDLPATTLALDLMEMGFNEDRPSWLARTLALRDRLGPFQLAWLETLLRAADMRASAQPSTPAS